MNYQIIKQGINKHVIQVIKNKKIREEMKNKSVSFISVNCIGGCMCSDLGIAFLSPTVNLYFNAEDFIKFVENLSYFLECDLKNCKNKDYPIGDLDGIKIHFLHYTDFEKAKEKWNIRKNRIDFENIVLIFTDQNGCNDELIDRFSILPYKKIMFSSKPNNKYDWIVFLDKLKIKTNDGRTTVDDACMFRGFTGKRNYESCFSLIDFINGK